MRAIYGPLLPLKAKGANEGQDNEIIIRWLNPHRRGSQIQQAVEMPNVSNYNPTVVPAIPLPIFWTSISHSGYKV